MAYKDQDRQREANRRAAKKRRQKQKGMTQGMTNQGMTREKVIPEAVTPVIPVRPANFGLFDCQCMHCRQNRANGSKLVINHGPAKAIGKLGPNEVNRVSLPGDVDYDGVCG
jgi:hypothetical protein